MGSLGVSV